RTGARTGVRAIGWARPAATASGLAGIGLENAASTGASLGGLGGLGALADLAGLVSGAAAFSVTPALPLAADFFSSALGSGFFASTFGFAAALPLGSGLGAGLSAFGAGFAALSSALAFGS